jgi:colanic acid biosynthesis glycosyl transferase WcaI
MNLLFVTTYFEPDSGAAAVRLSRLAHILRGRGHTVTVLATMPHYPQGKIKEGYRRRLSMVEDRDGVRVVRTWLKATTSPKISRKLISQQTFMLTAALRGIGLKRPDVVLIEAQPIFTSLAGVLLSKIKRRPYVLNISDLWPDHLLSVGALTETSKVYRTARKMVDATYRGAAGITAMSPAWAEAIGGYIGADDKIQVIYNGVDLARFHPKQDAAAFRAKYDLKTAQLVTFIGTFATQYDFDAMFSVAEQMQSRLDTTFVFIGGGSQVERVEQCALPNVRHIPWVAHDEIPQAWTASTLTYWAMRDHPLYAGTIPAKLYESLACGVPIVAAMAGEGARMIQESGGGVIVPCGDVEGLAAAVGRVLDDNPLRTHYAQSARLYAETHFDPERVATAYENVLSAAASKNK